MSHTVFSIIIPHRNIIDLLIRCLDSIPDNEGIQVIVVDDNSGNQDELARRIEGLKRSNVEYHLTKEGRGAGYARNVGLAKAKGEWLLFADSDDFFTDGAFDIISSVAEKEHDLVFFNVDSVESSDVSKKSFRTENKRKMIAKCVKEPQYINILKYLYTEPWGKLYKKSLIDSHGIRFSETRVCNDLFFSIQASVFAKQPAVCDETIYINTYRTDSLCINTNEDFGKSTVRLAETAKSQLFVDKHDKKNRVNLLHGAMVMFLKAFPAKWGTFISTLRKQHVGVCRFFKYMFFGYNDWKDILR